MTYPEASFSLASGTFTARALWRGNVKRGVFVGSRTADQLPVLVSTRVARDGQPAPDTIAWTFKGLAPVLYFGEPDPGPDVGAGARGFHVAAVVEELPKGIRAIERSGRWSPADCARIGLGLCDLAAEAAGDAAIVQFLRPEIVFANEDNGRWKYAGTTLRSYVHLGHGGDARHRSPYGDQSYMAPEIQLCEAVSSASDVFSIGLVLWQFSTGEHAFGDAPIPAEELASLRPYNGPAELRPLLERAVARAPQERPSIDELHRELTRIASV